MRRKGKEGTRLWEKGCVCFQVKSRELGLETYIAILKGVYVPVYIKAQLKP